MRICMVLEGCYPYVRGGVSSWVHSLITSNPQHEYVLWVIGALAEDRGKFKYELPFNVAEIHEVFLDDALRLTGSFKEKTKFNETEIEELQNLVLCQDPDWGVLFRLYNEKKMDPVTFLMSNAFLDILLHICKTNYPYISFAEFFHSIRSMFLPLLYLLSQEAPKADVYHAAATGYGGVLAALGAWKHKAPFILTEHGIYTREREEEILPANWISSYFKQHWINMFYMLSRCAYSRAACVTSLFQRYADIQTSLGCDPVKQKVIANGISLEQFISIPEKTPDGFIDIAGVVRIHPIKDIKTMIYAFFELKQRVPNVRLHILGDTDDEEYEEECRSLIEELQVEDIQIMGNVDVPEYLRNIDFVVLTSISEGQPLAVLESLAAGRACVTTDVGCCRQLLEGDAEDQLGKAGLCEPPMHAQSIADAMELLAIRPDLRREMAAVGRRRVQTYYVHEDMVRNYNKNYEEVMQKWQGSVLS